MGTSSNLVRVAVDAMGGDLGMPVIVRGALAACRELGVRVRLVGPVRLVEEEVARQGGTDLGMELTDAPEVVSMGERVTHSTLKRRSSIQTALECVRDGAADSFFSAGNTAACWTIAKRVLGVMDEVERPALAAVVPRALGRTLLIDVGATTECRPRQMEEFAVMGTVYMRRVYGVSEPRVGLMSMGQEESKGSDLTKEVHEALKGSQLNFVGNVEGHDLFTDRVDVVVMEGFTGNVVLKASETLAESLLRMLRQELKRSWRARLGAWLVRPAFRMVERRVDPDEQGGAPLLGVRGCCFIGHGRSTWRAVKQGIMAAAEFFRSGVNTELQDALRALAARRRAQREATA
jgi:glycerol-3-phosphate acyltransferase PlsX